MSLESDRQHERAVKQFLREHGLTQPRTARSVRTARDAESSAIRDELAFGAVHRPTAFGHERIVHFTGPTSELDNDTLSQESGAQFSSASELDDDVPRDSGAFSSFQDTGEFRVTPQMDPDDWDPQHEEDR